MVDAGLTEFDALKTSTVNATEFLRRYDKTGTIEAGKVADLVLLDGNPLENIANTKRICGVFLNGKWFDAGELEQMLTDVRNFYVDTNL